MNRRPYQAPVAPYRCIAHARTVVAGEGAQCMRRATVGQYCTQHALSLLKSGLREAITQAEACWSQASSLHDSKASGEFARKLGEE